MLIWSRALWAAALVQIRVVAMVVINRLLIAGISVSCSNYLSVIMRSEYDSYVTSEGEM